MAQNNYNSGEALDDVNRSVEIPKSHWWRRLLAFAGPAYMVSVGYMDPGNWATDLEGGGKFGYALIWVLLLSNAMAVLLQTLSARLGLVTGRDLAQACRDDYPSFVRYALFVLCEIAIAACDLAEVLGSAIGLNMLFGLPVIWGVLITGSDVLLLMVIQRWGIRKMEAVIILLISTIGACFVVELFLCKPDWAGVAGGFVPKTEIFRNSEMLYVAIGIIGATVMPHNLYMHSALVQSRNVNRSRQDVAQACRFNLIDSLVAMNLAFLVNAAILVVAAATFFGRGVVVELQQAHNMLEGVLGSKVAPIAFALGLICAGQSSTVTGTLAGQITMEGFLNFRMRPWLRRLFTRAMAIIPAVAVILWAGKNDENAVYKLLIFSQVILSMQLPFAVVPLVKFTNSRRKMGPFASPLWVKLLAGAVSALIVALNAKLVYNQTQEWAAQAGELGWLVKGVLAAVGAALAGLLAWMVFKREREVQIAQPVTAQEVLKAAANAQKQFARVGVALEATIGDAPMLAEAISLAKAHKAELVLIHVVEGVGGQWYGPQTGDYESRQDEIYLNALAERILAENTGEVLHVRAVLGFGDVPRQIATLVRREAIDMLVVGGHGHNHLNDILHGQTIDALRHSLTIPILAVRQ